MEPHIIEVLFVCGVFRQTPEKVIDCPVSHAEHLLPFPEKRVICLELLSEMCFTPSGKMVEDFVSLHTPINH